MFEFGSSYSLCLENQFVTMCISLFIGVVFNPLSEIIIYERLQGVEALKRSYFFITEKWLAWFIPFVVFLIPIIGFQYEKALTVLIGFDPIFSFMSLMRPWLIDVNLNDPSIIATAICAIVFSVWYCIFRVFLYSELLKRG